MIMRSLKLSTAVALSLTIAYSFDAVAANLSSSLEPAAVHALRWAFYAPNGHRWEYSGILVLHNGEIMNNAFPRTLKKVDAVPMDAERQINPGDKLVAIYHTHPCKSKQYFSQYYSPQDLISAYYYNVPSFILDECTGDVHEFDPAVDHARQSGIAVNILRRDGTPRLVHLPAGRIVGNVGDHGPDLSVIEELVGHALYE